MKTRFYRLLLIGLGFVSMTAFTLDYANSGRGGGKNFGGRHIGNAGGIRGLHVTAGQINGNNFNSVRFNARALGRCPGCDPGGRAYRVYPYRGATSSGYGYGSNVNYRGNPYMRQGSALDGTLNRSQLRNPYLANAQLSNTYGNAYYQNGFRPTQFSRGFGYGGGYVDNLPGGCTYNFISGGSYWRCGSQFYQREGTGFMFANPYE